MSLSTATNMENKCNRNDLVRLRVVLHLFPCHFEAGISKNIFSNPLSYGCMFSSNSQAQPPRMELRYKKGRVGGARRKPSY